MEKTRTKLNFRKNTEFSQNHVSRVQLINKKREMYILDVGKTLSHTSILVWVYGKQLKSCSNSEKVFNVLRMDPEKDNGKIPALMEAMDLVLKTLRKRCIK